VLQRRLARETYVAHVGKEANKLGEVKAGLEQDPEVIYTENHRPDRNEWKTVILPRLREENLAAFALKCNVSERQLRTLVVGRSRPRVQTQCRILEALSAVYP
jgi:hypothetical protein